ncbi:MAG TPA: CpsB/CapC family capsule biosynthesis tyrosine phosphatase [Terriglobia bacterium]|nr:CpsB/CapC family capsule biosynthesis tyrosine phosphatase [Terriglobia bacterium]
MIDIHCHPLPATDDGAKTFEEAVQMCKMAAADGTTHLVATPHCNYNYKYQLEGNRTKLKELQTAVGENPKLMLGCDFHLSYDNIEQLLDKPRDFSINYTEYILVEFGEHFIPEQIDNAFYKIECAGLIPILTHPERNPVFQRKPELLYHWVKKGCLAQVTAKSYTGGFGSTAMRFSELWLGQNLINFFASDAHDLEYRPPILSDCYKKLVEDRGKELADLLLIKNPEAVINGQPLPPGPEPIDPNARKKRGWFSFLQR